MCYNWVWPQAGWNTHGLLEESPCWSGSTVHFSTIASSAQIRTGTTLQFSSQCPDNPCQIHHCYCLIAHACTGATKLMKQKLRMAPTQLLLQGKLRSGVVYSYWYAAFLLCKLYTESHPTLAQHCDSRISLQNMCHVLSDSVFLISDCYFNCSSAVRVKKDLGM
jgi:hypothetical protein